MTVFFHGKLITFWFNFWPIYVVLFVTWVMLHRVRRFDLNSDQDQVQGSNQGTSKIGKGGMTIAGKVKEAFRRPRYDPHEN
jgi:hypothetical protein